MQVLLTESAGEKLLRLEYKERTSIINFTETGNFKNFNDKVKLFINKHQQKNELLIVDDIYPLIQSKNKIYEIKDHINLSGYNPLQGPQFISLTGIYNSPNGIIVIGLKEGVELNKHEKKVLLKVGAKAYCYNLVSTVIYAVSLGLKIKAVGIVKSQSPLLY